MAMTVLLFANENNNDYKKVNFEVVDEDKLPKVAEPNYSAIDGATYTYDYVWEIPNSQISGSTEDGNGYYVLYEAKKVTKYDDGDKFEEIEYYAVYKCFDEVFADDE